jgi:hypothetical protein
MLFIAMLGALTLTKSDMYRMPFEHLQKAEKEVYQLVDMIENKDSKIVEELNKVRSSIGVVLKKREGIRGCLGIN